MPPLFNAVVFDVERLYFSVIIKRFQMVSPTRLIVLGKVNTANFPRSLHSTTSNWQSNNAGGVSAALKLSISNLRRSLKKGIDLRKPRVARRLIL